MSIMRRIAEENAGGIGKRSRYAVVEHAQLAKQPDLARIERVILDVSAQARWLIKSVMPWFSGSARAAPARRPHPAEMPSLFIPVSTWIAAPPRQLCAATKASHSASSVVLLMTGRTFSSGNAAGGSRREPAEDINVGLARRGRARDAPRRRSATKKVLQPALASLAVIGSSPRPYALALTTAAHSAVRSSRDSARQFASIASRSTVSVPPVSGSVALLARVAATVLRTPSLPYGWRGRRLVKRVGQQRPKNCELCGGSRLAKRVTAASNCSSTDPVGP